MPITDILEKNCRLYGDDVCLVEINPEMPETKRSTWKEYDLIEPSRAPYYRREITWNVFNEKANRFANLLLERGVQKGDKVGILLMNCLEWLPIYFGILKTGALAVPLNFRYSADEIKYCVELADVDILVFGPEFIGRVEEIADDIGRGRLLYFVGDISGVEIWEDEHSCTASDRGAGSLACCDVRDKSSIHTNIYTSST